MNTCWLELVVDTQPASLYALADALTAAGFDCLEIQDGAEWMERSAGLPPELMDEEVRQSFDNLCRIKLYVPDTPSGREEAALARSCVLAFDPSLCVGLSSRGEEDWLENWKKYYRPVRVGTRLLIQPEWLPVDNPDGRAVFLNDPGVCFGTGTHATTRLCLSLLEARVTGGETMLDIGCGSGILIICGLLLGAGRGVGVDIDPLAVDITRENAARNGIGSDRLTVCCQDIRDAKEAGCYDLITANLTSGLLQDLMPVLPAQLKPDGQVLLSGILEASVDDLTGAIQASGLTIEQIGHEDGWAAVVCRQIPGRFL